MMGAMTEIVVRRLERHENQGAAGVAARALLDAPTTVAMYGDDARDRLALPYADFKTLFAVLSSPQVAAFCGDCPVGVAAVSPPGHCIGDYFGASAGEVLALPVPGVGDPARTRVFWATWAAHDLADEHWHVGPVGVEPGFQGQGIGGAVMRSVCDAFDADDQVAWLETDRERNVRFYTGLGFEVVETTTVVGVPTWFMRRDPRSADPRDG
jgi:ribosomal protein S18 acetylase RimI-like enzyme